MRGELAGSAPPGSPQLRVVIASDLFAVRSGLQDIFAADLLADMSEDGRGTTEIVLAEALNNVVEHAYAQYPGKIEVTLNRIGAELAVEIIDTGLPMPGETLPVGGLVETVTLDDAPEGGFGWFLIRQLSRDLDYRRDAGRNILRFSLDAA